MNTPLANVFPAVESIVFKERTIDKEHLMSEVNKLFKETFDSDTLEAVYDGLQTKYDCELYGIQFSNRRTYVAFFEKPLTNFI